MAMRCWFAAAIAAGSALMAAPCRAESLAESNVLPETRRESVTRLEVWRAVADELGHRGLPEPQWPRVEELEMPAAVPALAARKLRVLSACWDEVPRRAQFRLECSSAGACLPFLVYLHPALAGEVAGSAPKPGLRASLGLCRPEVLYRPPAAASKSAVHPGEPARAVFAANGLRMTARVTCLDRGREGDVIRARAPDGHILRARISGHALLEVLPQ
ncbi:MAG: hypothetical protein WAK29_03225 [Terriglobales bacterium]